MKINAFPMRYDIWKERKKASQKADSNSGWSRQNEYDTRFTICSTGAEKVNSLL